MTLCSIGGCNDRHHSHGWCSRHYSRWVRQGDPTKVVKRASGDGSITARGYLSVQRNGSKRFEHVRIAERALGKPLPHGAIVHHANETKSDNRNENLVICQNRAYHNLIHTRMRALAACGNANRRKCKFCKTYDDTNNLYVGPSEATVYHRRCFSAYANKGYHRRRAAAYKAGATMEVATGGAEVAP